ncbi:glycosyl transferase family 2, partial [Streptococcus agalactiae]
MGLTSCLFRHSQYSPFRLFIVFLRLTSTTG